SDQKDQEAERAYLGRGLAAGRGWSTERAGGACHDAHLVEDVALVGLAALLAQEQFCGDLRVGLAVGDEPRGLRLAFGQRFGASSVGRAWPGAPVDVICESSQLAFCMVAVSERAEGAQCRCGELELEARSGPLGNQGSGSVSG